MGLSAAQVSDIRQFLHNFPQNALRLGTCLPIHPIICAPSQSPLGVGAVEEGNWCCSVHHTVSYMLTHRVPLQTYNSTVLNKMKNKITFDTCTIVHMFFNNSQFNVCLLQSRLGHGQTWTSSSRVCWRRYTRWDRGYIRSTTPQNLFCDSAITIIGFLRSRK